ncbi:MAG TPA: universal stress protein [Chloroflexota bacterium]|jgi:nucleotide-binding universal stress UspA family protein
MGTAMLVPLDGSELAEVALGYAEALGKALGWSAVLFCAVPGERPQPLFLPAIPPPIEASREVWDAWETELGTADEATREEAQGALDAMAKAAQRLHAAGVPVTRQVSVGSPRDAIVRRAADDDVAMIVMASHGRTGLRRLLQGSVAAGVVDHAHRPTLVVSPFHDGQQRAELKHADLLPAGQVVAVRQAIAAVD